MLKFNIAFSSAASLVGILVNFGFKVYLARFIGKQELVTYYLVMDLILLASYLIVGYKDVFVQQITQQENKAAIFALSNWFLISCTIPIILFVIPFTNILYLEPKIDNYQTSSLLLVLLFVANATINHLNNTLFAYREYKFAAVVELSASLLIILAYIFVSSQSQQWPGHQILIVATLTGYVATIFLQTIGISFRLSELIPTLTSLSRTWRKKERNYFIKSTSLASLEYFANRMPLLVTPFLMLQFYQLDDLGDFQVVARPIYLALIAVCVDPVYRILFPEFARMIADRDLVRIRSIRKKFVLYLLLFSIGLFAGTWLLAKPVITWLFTESYADSHLMLNILIVAIPLGCYRAMSFALLKGAGMFKQTMLIRVASAMAFILVILSGSLFNAPVDVLIYGIVVSVALSFILTVTLELRLLNQL